MLSTLLIENIWSYLFKHITMPEKMAHDDRLLLFSGQFNFSIVFFPGIHIVVQCFGNNIL